MPSIAAAHAAAVEAGLRIQVVAIFFEHERLALEGVLPPFVELHPILARNRTAGEYLQRVRGLHFGAAEVPLRGPIVSDVWQAMYNLSRADRIVWTNWDIILSPEFYTHLAAAFSSNGATVGHKHLLGASLLRRDVLIPVHRFSTIADWSAEAVFSWNYSRPQAGHDSLVFPTRWLLCFDLQDIVFGVGGWDHSVYTQMKRMAHLDEGQFRTLSAGSGLPDPLGLTAHVGSQIANPKRWFTNPVSWKGEARAVQYASNKKQKGIVESYLSLIKGPSHMCSRSYMARCGAPPGNAARSRQETTRLSFENDWRLLALAVPTPLQGPDASAMLRLLADAAVGSTYNTTLGQGGAFNALRAAHIGLLTHAADLWPGPKPANVLEVQAPPGSKPAGREKGRVVEFHSAILIVDDPLETVGEWLLQTGADHSAEAARPLVQHYVRFWEFWLDRLERSATPVALLKLDPADAAEAGQQLAALSEFLAFFRCGSRKRWLCQPPPAKGAAKAGMCCVVDALPSLPAIWARRPAVAAKQLPEETAAFIREETAAVAGHARAAWADVHHRHRLPEVLHCCGHN